MPAELGALVLGKWYDREGLCITVVANNHMHDRFTLRVGRRLGEIDAMAVVGMTSTC